MCVTWLIYVLNMCVTWFIYVIDMCVCIHIHICVCLFACIYLLCMHAYICVWHDTFTWVIRVCVYVYIYTFVCWYVNICCVFEHTYLCDMTLLSEWRVCVCIYTCIRVCVCMYTSDTCVCVCIEIYVCVLVSIHLLCMHAYISVWHDSFTWVIRVYIRYVSVSHACTLAHTLTHPTQSIMYVPLQVNRFQKSVLFIVQYKYLKSCSGDLILQNLILRTRSCGTCLITQSTCGFHFHPTIMVGWKYLVPRHGIISKFGGINPIWWPRTVQFLLGRSSAVWPVDHQETKKKRPWELVVNRVFPIRLVQRLA